MVRRRPRWARVLLGLSILGICLAVLFLTYEALTKSSRDERRLEKAIQVLRANQEVGDLLARLEKWPRERMLLLLAELIPDYVPGDEGLMASRAALDIAASAGSLEARIQLGKAHRDGTYGKKDAVAALKVFNEVLATLSPGIKTSDNDALYVYSLMLREGLGVEADERKADEILLRVAPSRDWVTRQRLAQVLMRGSDRANTEAVKSLVRQLIAEGHTDNYLSGVVACSKQFPAYTDEDRKAARMAISGQGGKESWEAVAAARDRQRAGRACKNEFLKAAADKGNTEAQAMLAEAAADSTFAKDASTSPGSPSTALPTATTPHQPEQQTTGYLNGERQGAPAGRSTFQIDNADGEANATVRLYLNGQRASLRSVYVRKGEGFTLRDLAPGAYIMRYRFAGSGKTFKADETFHLAETRTPEGITFSRVRVTLYRVPQGNLSVSEVPSTDF